MKKSTFADRASRFYQELRPPQIAFAEVEVISPLENPAVRLHLEEFYSKYYADNSPRVFVFGINPGRFGSGTTGVPFTDPVALEEACGIPNDIPKRRELSSEFIYNVVNAWGGTREFYSRFFVTSVSPLGFVKNGVNFNYYDDPAFAKLIEPFIVETMHRQLELGASRETVVILGSGKNREFFERLNAQHAFFKKVLVLEHPRFIMQYRRKSMVEYLSKYKAVLLEALQ